MFNLRLYNVNAQPEYLKKYDIEKISTVHIDTVRFCQLIGKIAHVYAVGHLGQGAFTPLMTPFIHTDIAPQQLFEEHYDNIGGLWSYKETKTDTLHEIEIGEVSWQNRILVAARVRLFASYGMLSYFVAVGKPIG